MKITIETDAGEDTAALVAALRRLFTAEPSRIAPALRVKKKRRRVSAPPPVGRRDVATDWFVEAADVGQHDTMKRWAYLALYRWLKPNVPIIPANFETGPETYALQQGPLFPLQLDLSEACRRLGFARLFGAAAGRFHVDLQLLYDACNQGISEGVSQVSSRLKQSGATVAVIADAAAAAETLFDVGAWIRTDLDACPPLAPLTGSRPSLGL